MPNLSSRLSHLIAVDCLRISIFRTIPTSPNLQSLVRSSTNTFPPPTPTPQIPPFHHWRRCRAQPTMRGIRSGYINPLQIIQQLGPAPSSQTWSCKPHVPHGVHGTSIHNKPLRVYSCPFSTSRPPLQARVPQPVGAAARLAADVSPGKLTPPESSVPVALDVPERDRDESAFGYYFKVGKGYVRPLFGFSPRGLVCAVLA